MSASPAEQTPAVDAVATLREATSVRLRVHKCGAAVATAGVVGRALRTLDVPFHVRAADALDTVARDDVVAAVGLSDTDADLELDPSNAALVARELGVDPDPAVALAGLHAAGTTPKEDTSLTDAAADAGVEAEPGVAVPTGDLADGLAHSTLVHAPFSADRERVQADPAKLSFPAELDADARRRVASLVATDAMSGRATAHAATAVEHVLGPETTPSGPFKTVGGFADMLDATIRESPRATVALTLGHGIRDVALDAWRDHAQVTHAALRGAATSHYESLPALSCDLSSPGRLTMVARLARDFRSPEPTVLAVGIGAAVLVSTDPTGLDEDLAAAASDLPAASATGSPSEAAITFDPTAEPSDVVVVVREVRR